VNLNVGPGTVPLNVHTLTFTPGFTSIIASLAIIVTSLRGDIISRLSICYYLIIEFNNICRCLRYLLTLTKEIILSYELGRYSFNEFVISVSSTLVLLFIVLTLPLLKIKALWVSSICHLTTSTKT
jgi:hypothetical protein